MSEANVALAGVARGREARGTEPVTTRQFLCECGDRACTEWVELELEEYEAIRSIRGHVLAPGHALPPGQAARRAAADLRDDARALKAQAEQQLRRSQRLISRERPAGGR
jgi:hypothetical protein